MRLILASLLASLSAAMATSVATKKILCLHGKGELGAEFFTRIGSLRKAAGPGFEWEALDAPHAIGDPTALHRGNSRTPEGGPRGPPHTPT